MSFEVYVSSFPFGSEFLQLFCRIPRIETCGIWGRKLKGKEDPQQVIHDARTPTTKETTTKNVYLTSVGSAALPESEASNYTYTKVQRKTTEGTREKTEGRGETRERMKKKREKAIVRVPDPKRGLEMKFRSESPATFVSLL